MTEKQYLRHWEEHVRKIMASTSIVVDESPEESQERKAELESDPEEWFKYYFPRYAYAPPAAFHKEATKRVLQNPEWCEVRLWSRELAKSTRTMMEVLYLTLVGHPPDSSILTPTPTLNNSSKPTLNSSALAPRPSALTKRHVLLISNSLDNAVRLLLPYKANLELNRRIIQDYGLQESAGNWQVEEFTTQSGVAFRALGAGQSPRGSRNEEIRPDIIIFDDIDTDVDCLNPDIVARKWRWIEEAAIGTRSISQATTIIFCGNRIAADCCIERATNIADHVDEVNIRDVQGNSSWPEKNAEVDIDRVLSQKSYAAQQKEYFNNPLTEGAVFRQMSFKPALPLFMYDTLVCYTDPSYKDTNDYKATVLVGRHENEFHIIKCYLDKATTAQMIEWHYQIMDRVGERSCSYFMEQVFMQDVIVKEVSQAGAKRGRHIPIRGDTRRKPDKFVRIESLLEPLNRNGQLYLNEGERHNPHMQRLVDQFTAFAPGSRAHDDGPDAVEGAIWQINNRYTQSSAAQIVSFPLQNHKRF